MEVGANEVANSEAEPALGRPDSPLEPADEQAMSELLELCPPRSEVPQNSMAKIWEPKCSRCVVFRDNGIHYLRIISEHISPRISALEALKPENNMLKKLNAELTTQLEESIQSDQISKARAAAAEEEIIKMREALESMEKDYYGMAKAAEEGKKHANEASVWRVKYEKIVEICEKIQEKRKKESANFDKVLNLAEGYKKELDIAKKKMLEVKGKHVRFVESHRKYVPSMHAVMMQIDSLSSNIQNSTEASFGNTSRSIRASDPSFAKEHPGIYAEATRLCHGAQNVLNSPAILDDEDDMCNELERLINGPAMSEQRERHNAESPYVAETCDPDSSRPASAIPSNAPVDFVLSELNEDEADDLLDLGAEAATVTPAVSARKEVKGVAKARGGGVRRARGSKQTSKPSNFAGSVDHDELNRRFNEVLESKLKRTAKDASEPCTSGLKHMSIHGKKTISVRAQQEAQMKVSIKEKVAAMRMLESSKTIISQTLDNMDNEVLSPRKLPEIPERTIGDPVDIGAELGATSTELQNVESTSPAKSKSSYSCARNDLLLSESPSPASSIAEGEVVAKDFDINLLAFEEFGTDKQQEDISQPEVESEVDMAISETPFTEESGFQSIGQQEPVPASVDVDVRNETLTTTLASSNKDDMITDVIPISRRVEIVLEGERVTSADTGQFKKCADNVAESDAHETVAKPGLADQEGQIGDIDASSPALLEQVEQTTICETVIEETTRLETPDDTQKDMADSISASTLSEQEKRPAVPEAMMESETVVAVNSEATVVIGQKKRLDESQNNAGAAVTALAEKSEDKIRGPSEELDSVSIAVAFRTADSDELQTMATLNDTISIRLAEEVIVNAEATTSVDVLRKVIGDGSDAKWNGETLATSETASSDVTSPQLSQTAAPTVREDSISRDSLKPHLAKDTKRALGVMRRLEDALKGKVEPIKDVNEISKRTSSHEEQPSADVGTSGMLASTKKADADVSCDTSLSMISEGSHDAVLAQREASSETVTDKEASSGPASKTIENDHQEAMRLHAALNRPPRRTRKDSERVSQDNLSDLGAAKPNVSAKRNSKRKTSQSEMIGSGSVEDESRLKSMSKTAALKETFNSNKEAGESDMIESILAGAHMGPSNPTAAMPTASVDGSLLECHSKPAMNLKSVANTLDSPALSKADQTAFSPSGDISLNKSEICDVNASVAAVVTQKRSRGRPKNVQKDSTREYEVNSELKDSAKVPKVDAPALRTRTRSRSSLISPPLSSRSSRKSSSEEVSVLEAKKGKTDKIPMLETHETRLATRRRNETIKPPTLSQSTPNGSTEEQLLSAESSKSRSAAAQAKRNSTGGSRKRLHESQCASVVPEEPLSVKKLKSLSFHLQTDTSPASRTRRKVDTSAEPINTLGLLASHRNSTRTKPFAPKKRKSEPENIAAEDGKTTGYASSETSDEDRLCVACGDEEEEISQQNLEKNVITQLQQNIDEHLEEEDDEERLIIENEEDEHENKMDTVMQLEGVAEQRVKPSKCAEETCDTRVYGNEKDNSLTGEISATQSISDKGVLPKVRPLSHIEKDVRTLPSGHQSTGGLLQAARRSLPSTSSGINAMQRVSARISKQLQKVGSVSSSRSRASDISTRNTVLPKARILSEKKSQATEEASSSIDKTDRQLPKTRQVRGSKRKLETTSEQAIAVKKLSSTETALEKKLHGALLSEQTIEVIRKNLGSAVELIAQMGPVEFASTMIKCCLNLPSGDMWTIIQTRYRESESVDVHNKKEEAFVSIAKKLAGSDQIWVEFVKGMIVTLTTQIPNAVNTTRYIRLLCQGLHQAGDLLTNEEKQSYLRAALTELFMVDTGIAMKATVYALLSSAFESLVWMSNRDDPFSVLLSLAVTTYQNDGKILMWAWFQRFPKELQLHDITPDILRKSFDDLLKRLAELAGERGCYLGEDGSSELLGELTQEETVLLNMGASYVMAVSESLSVVRAFVDSTLKHCMSCVMTAFNPRATDGTNGYSEAFVVSSKLRFCTNLIFKAITFKDNANLNRNFCALLQEHVSTIREVCDGINESVEEKPWKGVYLQALRDLLNLLQILTQYEI